MTTKCVCVLESNSCCEKSQNCHISRQFLQFYLLIGYAVMSCSPLLLIRRHLMCQEGLTVLVLVFLLILWLDYEFVKNLKKNSY